MTAKDVKIISCIGKWMTIRIRHSDIGGLRFYMHSRVRICITMFDTLLPEVWAKDGGPTLTEMGLGSVQELAQWLLTNGARQVKKPRPLRRVIPIYD